eukprot:PhM_4_TR13363/c2_g1_i1/m.64970
MMLKQTKLGQLSAKKKEESSNPHIRPNTVGGSDPYSEADEAGRAIAAAAAATHNDSSGAVSRISRRASSVPASQLAATLRSSSGWCAYMQLAPYEQRAACSHIFTLKRVGSTTARRLPPERSLHTTSELMWRVRRSCGPWACWQSWPAGHASAHPCSHSSVLYTCRCSATGCSFFLFFFFFLAAAASSGSFSTGACTGVSDVVEHVSSVIMLQPQPLLLTLDCWRLHLAPLLLALVTEMLRSSSLFVDAVRVLYSCTRRSELIIALSTPELSGEFLWPLGSSSGEPPGLGVAQSSLVAAASLEARFLSVALGLTKRRDDIGQWDGWCSAFSIKYRN